MLQWRGFSRSSAQGRPRLLAWFGAWFALSLPAPAQAHPARLALPPAALQALQHAGIAADAMAVVVHDTGTERDVLLWQEQRALNPASLIKLLPTLAALERLGPAFTWSTPVWLGGPVKGGILEGSVFLKGSGDPKLVIERVWLLLRRLQQLGVREIRGDIVLDNSAFVVPEGDPADFDGEPLRPYNVRPAALLLNYRSVTYSFTPDEAACVARVNFDPALAGTQVDRTVPLAIGPCADWRGALKASFEPGRTRWAGSYALACGEVQWLVADPQPASYDARLIEALWREMSGTLQGSVREGPAPVDAKPSFEHRSPPLAEVVRDINKFSNNLMAQQLFYTLALQARRTPSVGLQDARETLMSWLIERTGERTGDLGSEVVIDNGSGLSRHTRISAQRLARLLVQAHAGPVMSELMSSLPVSGVDGTMRRSRALPGRAHLKTGSLRDVHALAGYVLSNSGRRYVVVAIVNHANAGAARPALEAVLQWTVRDAPRR